MKVKIRSKCKDLKEVEDLLVEPDITNPHEFVRIRKDLWDKLVQEMELLVEATDKEREYCNAKGMFSLKDLLIRLNLISKASKGKLVDK